MAPWVTGSFYRNIAESALQGVMDGEQVVIKKYELTRRGSADALQQELWLYAGGNFRALQGVSIPRMKTYGLLPHSGTPFLALSYAGEPLYDSLHISPVVGHSAKDEFQIRSNARSSVSPFLVLFTTSALLCYMQVLAFCSFSLKPRCWFLRV